MLLSIALGACRAQQSPVGPKTSDEIIGRQGQDEIVIPPPIGEWSTCCGERGLDPYDYFTYIDFSDQRVSGNFEANLLASMRTYLEGVANENNPGEIIFYETIPDQQAIVDINPPVIHWRFIDFGWGVMPSNTMVSMDGGPASNDNLEFNYAQIMGYDSRLVMLYDVIYRPPVPLVGGIHQLNLQLAGLNYIYSDSDSDGLPDPAEINTSPLNPDTDSDGLNDCVDPCPTNPDSDGDGIPDGSDTDIDGNGEPDPPLLCLGYGGMYVHVLQFEISGVDFPQPAIAGFPVDEYEVEDRTHVQMMLEDSVPDGYEPITEQSYRWTVITNPAIPNLYVVQVSTEGRFIDVELSLPVPNEIILTLECHMEDLGTEILELMLSLISLIITPDCICPSIATDLEEWECCKDNIGHLLFHCGSCPFMLYMEGDRDTPTKENIDEALLECCAGYSATTGGVIFPFKWNITWFILIRLWQCPDIDLPIPLSRCSQWDIKFTLKCFSNGEVIETTAEIHTPEPDIYPPSVSLWWTIENIEYDEACYVEMKTKAIDDCLEYYFYITVFYDEHMNNAVVRSGPIPWGECREVDKTYPPCDEACRYWKVDPNALCHVNCIQVLALDTCGNWNTACLEEEDLPKPRTLEFKTPEPGDCADFNNPAWKQYVNLPKDHHGSVCDDDYLPHNYSDFIIAWVRVQPTLPGVRIDWHQVDPWHRPCFPNPPNCSYELHNKWNWYPNPLWENINRVKHTIDCGDPIEWVEVYPNYPHGFHDNRDTTSCFKRACPHWWNIKCYLNYQSSTDCYGNAYVRFYTSNFGGDNHIIVADTCEMGEGHVNPVASQTIEIWRLTEIYPTEMSGTNDPQVLCDYEHLYGRAYPGPFINKKFLITTAFEDCFDQVDFSLGETVDFKLQTLPDPCNVCVEIGSDFHYTNPARWCYNLTGLDYYWPLTPQNLCDLDDIYGKFTGMACPDPSPTNCWPSHKHANVWIGYTIDTMHINGFSPRDIQLFLYKLPAHELGHEMGDLWPWWIRFDQAWLHIDTDPPQSTIDELIAKYYMDNGEWAKSIMFYSWDAPYFNPDHILTIRSHINCEGLNN